MKKILLITFLYFTAAVTAQPGLMWVKQFGGSHGDEAVAVETDASGNVIMVGNIKDTVDADPGPGTQLMFGDYLDDVMITKLDAGGNLIWAKQISASGQGYINATAMNLTSAGNIIISGYFTDIVDFNPGTATYTVDAKGTTDGFVCCLDASGNFKWAKTIGGSGGSGGTYIQGAGLSRGGEILLTGSFKSSADFNPGPATFSLTAKGNGDAFLCKLDANGNFVWAQQFGDVGYYDANTVDDVGLRVQADAFDNIYLAGTFESIADFDGGSSSFTMQPSSSRADIFILKLNSAGNFVWVRQVSGPDIELVNALKVSPSGEVYLTGLFESSVDVDPGFFSMTLTATTEPNAWYDVFLLKLDVNGNYSWAKQLTGKITKTANGLYVASNGNILLTGTFYDTVDFDPGPGTHTLTSVAPTDAYILQLSSTGDFRWVYQMGGMFSFLADHNSGKSITCDANGNIYTTGKFIGSGDMDPTGGTYNLTTPTMYTDIYLMKLGGIVGLNENKFDNELISVYPNPTSGILKIKTGAAASNIRVYNILGAEIMNTITINEEINMSGLPKGI
jgi:hypothetical protein